MDPQQTDDQSDTQKDTPNVSTLDENDSKLVPSNELDATPPPEKPVKVVRKKNVLESKKVMIIVGTILGFLVVVAAVLVLVPKPDVYSNLRSVEGRGYTVNVPDGWNVSDEGNDQVSYYNGDNLEDANDAIIVGFSDDPFPGYTEYTDEQKKELVELFDGLLQTSLTSTSGGSNYDSVITSEGSHPDADRAINLSLSGENSNGTTFKGEGSMIVTENGYFYFVLVGSEIATFDNEVDTIRSIISDFNLTLK